MNTCFRSIFRVIIVSVAFFYVSQGTAQCAGTGTELTICNKETDPNLQTFNLFDVLTGETAGGTWIAESNYDSSALDETNGILNLWGINRFGAHAFTYMNPGCDTSTATVTINLGGYPGESNQNPGTNNVCQVLKVEDDDAANIIDLFIFIDTINNGIVPDVGGVWTEDSNNLALNVLNDEFFKFGNVPIGIYTFTYTIPADDSCSERSITIDVEVHRIPNTGKPVNLYLCETDDMSGLTNLDLFSRLDGEDSDGVWTDGNIINTGEITSGNDSEIDVQNIYNNLGTGTYTFTYKVLPEHPICEEKESVFTVCIEKQLNLSGNVTVACDGTVDLTYDDTLLTNGSYNLSYTVTGSGLGTYSDAQSVLFQNGTAQFQLLPELLLTTSETLTIQIDDIVASASCGQIVLCTSIVTVPSVDFDMYIEPSIIVSSTSGCELDDILITYNNAVDASFAPLNGVESVSYSINSINFTEDLTFANGNATSTISVERFIQGVNQLVFFSTNSFIHCKDINKNTVLNLIPAPPNPIFSIVPDDKCNATSLQFGFDSPSGEFITYSSVTFDIYQFGSEPQQFGLRDPSVSLTNNTQGDGVDINLTNSNDVSALPDGDYVFVIRSVQNDNTPCRGLSQLEIDNYAAQGITIGLTQNDNNHVFDARLTFRIGDPDPVELIKRSFQVCLLNGAVTLNDLSLFAGADVDITVTDLAGVELSNTYEITQDESFIAVLKSAITGCDLGIDEITVTVVSQASKPILNNNIFCSEATNTVADLEVSGQDITWYNTDVGGTAYTSSYIIDTNNEYWAEVIISGGCVSTSRTQAVISFIDKAATPTPLANEFCSAANPTISDLMVQSETDATLQWYTSETGSAYTSTSLQLDETKEYWVSQTVAVGCESDRVQVIYTITDVAMNLDPLVNDFCTANGDIFTLEDISYSDASISREGVISYFSDQEGTIAIQSTELLENITSPVYAQQVVAGTCSSDIVEVNFRVQGIAAKPELSDVTLCLVNNPTVQDLIDVLQSEASNEITLYEDETTTTAIDVNLELASLSGTIYASQSIIDDCGSLERELVNLTLENPTITSNDFKKVHCSLDTPTLSDVYLGSENALWFNQDMNPLLGSEALQNEESYFAQLEIGSCLSSTLEVVISLVDVLDPVASSTDANFCGITEKIIADLLEDDAGNTRFTVPLNHTLVWYDSDDVSARNLLDEDTVLQQGVYYVVYEVDTTIEGESILCESNSLAISVDLTKCSPEELVIPDAFSPNGDKINDTFELLNIQFVYPDYTIEIYNRYGRVVFKGNADIGFWDGKSNQSGSFGNDILPTGVYFYVINFNRLDKKPYQGQVYLKR